MSNNPLPIIAVGALGLSSISCVISSLTGFLLSDDSNVESNTSTDTSNTSTDTSNTSTETDYTIPHQIEPGADGWCVGTDSVHQDVPGCGRICSSATNVGSKRDGTWGPWADNSTVASTCVGAKLDEIWEVQDDGIRKLADGYTLSTFGKPSYFEEGVEYTIKGSRDGGKYCANDDTDGMICDRDVASGWEKFKFTQVGSDIYGIKSMRTDKYCKDNLTGNMSCNHGLNAHEKLTIEKHGDKYSIKGPWGNKYCSDQPGGLICDTGHLQEWEKFTITKASDPAPASDPPLGGDIYHCLVDTDKTDIIGDWNFYGDSFTKNCAKKLDGENHSEETCLGVTHGRYPATGDPVITNYCKWELK